MKTVCILTRYNEYIDWVQGILKYVDYIYIYNKGSNTKLFKSLVLSEDDLKKIQIQTLPNIGRIDHSIAYHITKNWENLDDIIISLPGSVLMCAKKGAYLNMVIRNIKNIKSKYNGFYSPRFHKTTENFTYNINNYMAEGLCNRNNNLFIKSEYPDFQAWKIAIVDVLPMKYLAMRGMFIVCKENIKHISKEIYDNLVISLSVGDNIENGHFAERIWAHLFRQYDNVGCDVDNHILLQYVPI